VTVPHGPVDVLLAELHASRGGLTADEARRRLGEVGPNEPARAPRTAGLVQILLLLANPLVIILLIASAASAILGERVNASIIVLMVALSVVLNFVQTYRSHRVAERLRDTVAPTATALRDGTWLEIRRRELVPGDIVRLAAGDRVPADARLLEARDLHVQQAALTGESMPAEKDAADIEIAPRQPADARNVVFLGTSVVSGTATALVVATGPATAFGDIAARLSTRPPETEFERGTRQFALLIMRTVFFLVLFVLLAGALLHHAFLESLLFAVALAVGLTPEFLPMISAVTLSRGAAHMARQKVIVKHLEAIENFGSMDVLFSDKTGTLTSGEMVLDRHLDPLGQVSERPLALAYVNSSYQTGIKSPLDGAILKRGAAAINGYRKIDEIPFDFERRRLSVVVENGGGRLLITKGAPEGVIARCTAYETDRGSARLDEAMRARCEATYRDLSAHGSRVLAVAYARVPPQAVYSADDERELVLAGFVAFFDPPMEGVAETLHALRRDGVVVKILTGDNELVAQHVCGQVGLDSARIVAGDQIERMTDSALAAVAEQTTVFARVSPAQKNRIILALKSRNHVVGFLGDGINDAPSIHTADVGVSVATAVDVAKDAADIILLERNLNVLHTGILEGRRAFGNVMKYLLMGTSSNFGNMFSMAGAFLPAVPADAADSDPAQQLPLRSRPGHDPHRQCRRSIHPDPTAVGHRDHPEVHGGDRAHQLDLRLPHVWGAAVGLPRLRGALPDGLVRRVARDADTRPLRHPDCWQSLAQPAEPPAGGHHCACGADRRGLALHAARRYARLRAAPGRVLRIPRRSDHHLSRPRRAGQTPTDAQTARHGHRNACGQISHPRTIGPLMQQGTIVEGMQWPRTPRFRSSCSATTASSRKRGGSLMSRRFTAYRRCVGRTGPVGIVTSIRARPKSVRRSKRRFGISA